MSAQDKETGAPSGALREKIWTCKIGGVVGELPPGADAPMRNAIYKAFLELTGFHADFNFSGWGGKLDEMERAVVENRAPDFAAEPTTSLTLKIDTSALQETIDEIRDEFEQYQAEHKRLVRELDVALNGEAGAAPQASLCDLVAQVKRQQPVQIVNLADGMRINFRAPDGRRGTLHLSRVIRDVALGAMIQFEDGIIDVLRAAIAAYPLAGEPQPELHSDDHDSAQVQALAASQVHPESALPSVKGSPWTGCGNPECPEYGAAWPADQHCPTCSGADKV